jgi:hypothetical protein
MREKILVIWFLIVLKKLFISWKVEPTRFLKKEYKTKRKSNQFILLIFQSPNWDIRKGFLNWP